MVTSTTTKQSDVAVRSFSEPAGDNRYTMEGISIEFSSRTLDVDLSGRALAVELQPNVLGAQWVSVKASNGQGMSDDQGRETLAGRQELVVGLPVGPVGGQSGQGFLYAVEDALKDFVERRFDEGW